MEESLWIAAEADDTMKAAATRLTRLYPRRTAGETAGLPVPLRSLSDWVMSSGLSPRAEQMARDTLTSALPILALLTGLGGTIATAMTYFFFPDHFRALTLLTNPALMLCGCCWLWRPPAAINRATVAVSLYLLCLIGSMLLAGDFNPKVQMAVVGLGASYLAIDRRVFVPTMIIWVLWISAIGWAWLPDQTAAGVVLLLVCTLIGGFCLRHLRRSSVENLAALSESLAQTIAEREEAVHRAQQAEKLESLGLMAAGVAHDYNNLLVGVIGGLDLLETAKGSVERETALKLMRSSASSLQGLSAQLMEVAGGRPIVRRPLDVNAIILETLAGLAPEADQMARVRLDLGDDLSPVMGEPDSLKQVVLNLLTNAFKFASEKVGAVEIGSRSAGANILFWVRDDGPGIAPEVRSRIFDPFFTSDQLGKGLGLATAQTIVQRHSGSISVGATTQGACLEVLLPSVAYAQHRDHGAIGGIALDASKHTVLLVDDNPVVLEVTAEMLRSIDYQVVSFASGERAVQTLRQKACSPDVALIDYLMPGLSGTETAEALRQLEPKLPIVMYSGYQNSFAEKAQFPQHVGFLAKPFTVDQLRRELAVQCSAGCQR